VDNSSSFLLFDNNHSAAPQKTRCSNTGWKTATVSRVLEQRAKKKWGSLVVEQL
jgi:hypothetical protein